MTTTTSSDEFAGQCAVVSGAGSGIGATVVHCLIQRGARVIAMDVDNDGLSTLGRTHGNETLHIAAVDVSDPSTVSAAFEAGVRQLGPVDKLVCAAGRLQMGTVTELTSEQWAQTFATHTVGVFNLCQVAARHMQTRGRGGNRKYQFQCRHHAAGQHERLCRL